MMNYSFCSNLDMLKLIERIIYKTFKFLHHKAT